MNDVELTEGSTNKAYSPDMTDDKHAGGDVENGLHGGFVKAKPTVVFVGSGDMTLALAKCMARAGIHPVVASRDPARARSRLKGIVEVEVVSLVEGAGRSDVVVVAIPAEHHHTLSPQLLQDKVVVDISNRDPKASKGVSVGERLQAHLPRSHVVKAFNTMSSYALMQDNIQGSREVPVCGESEAARARVSGLVRELGLTPVDRGGLANARAIEDIPMAFFPEWRPAAITTALLLIIWFIFMLFRNQICPNINSGKDWDWSTFGTLFTLQNFQFTFAYTGASLLLLTYIPGTLAGYIQLYRGTKYAWFPAWLDTWLKARKHLGLLALLFGSTHAIGAIFTQMGWTVSYPEEWHQQLHFLFASLLEAALVILGITSLPSVSARMTWREFSVVQRYLGWGCVLFLTIHVVFSYLPTLLTDQMQCVVLASGAQVMSVMCLLVIALKLPLLIPCVDSHLGKIRRGYERNRPSSPAWCQET